MELIVRAEVFGGLTLDFLRCGFIKLNVAY